MNEKQARAIASAFLPPVLAALEDYITDRIEQQHLLLEKAQESEVKHIQGAIYELKRLRKIRDAAMDVIKEN